jgi:hypothetical protein
MYLLKEYNVKHKSRSMITVYDYVKDFVSDHLGKEIIMSGKYFGVVYLFLFEKKKVPKKLGPPNCLISTPRFWFGCDRTGSDRTRNLER